MHSNAYPKTHGETPCTSTGMHFGCVESPASWRGEVAIQPVPLPASPWCGRARIAALSTAFTSGAVAAPSEETSTSESIADTDSARTAERATTSQSTESSSSEDAESPRWPSLPEGAPWDAKVAWPPPNPPPAETKERYVEPATGSSISGTDAAPEPNGGANDARADSPPSLETEGWVAWPPPNPPPPSGP